MAYNSPIQVPTGERLPSITAPNQTNRVVGGIGIVFDSEPQFKSMLQETLPKDDSGLPIAGCFGLFVDQQGLVIAASDEAPVKVGERLMLDEAQLLALEPSESTSQLLCYQDERYIVGIAASKGYREYKTTGDYYNPVSAIVFIPL